MRLGGASSGVRSGWRSPRPTTGMGDTMTPRPKVNFFDVNETLLDLKPLKVSVGKALGGRVELVPLWFTTLPQYWLVSTTADRYCDLGEIGVACLRMVAK